MAFPLTSFVKSSASLLIEGQNFWSFGMNTSATEVSPVAVEVIVTDDELTVRLADGRRLSVPLVWFPRLLHATTEQRANFELLGEGEGIHWPDIDEDISVAGLLRGVKGPPQRKSRSAA